MRSFCRSLKRTHRTSALYLEKYLNMVWERVKARDTEIVELKQLIKNLKSEIESCHEEISSLHKNDIA